MNFSSLSQQSGSVSSKIRLSSKREHSSSNVSCGCIPSPRSHTKSHESNKRFKPNLNNSRTHATDNIEDHTERRFIKGSPSVSSQSPRCNYETSTHQGSLNGATEEEDNDEEGSKPFGGSKKNHLNNDPPLSGVFLRTEGVSTPSVIFPCISSVGPAEPVKELNLDAFQGSNDITMKFDEKEYLEMIQNEVGQYGFKCLSAKCPNADTFLNFKCPEGHPFSTNFNPNKRIECPKCQKRLQECAEYAKFRNGILFSLPSIGKLLNEVYEDTIQFECKNKHIWKVKYSK